MDFPKVHELGTDDIISTTLTLTSHYPVTVNKICACFVSECGHTYSTCIPRRPVRGWLCCDAWREEEGSKERTSSCPGELWEPRVTEKKKKVKERTRKKKSSLWLPTSWLWSNRSREGGASFIAWVKTSRLNPSVQTSSILQTLWAGSQKVCTECCLNLQFTLATSGLTWTPCRLPLGLQTLRYLPTIWTWDCQF